MYGGIGRLKEFQSMNHIPRHPPITLTSKALNYEYLIYPGRDEKRLEGIAYSENSPHGLIEPCHIHHRQARAKYWQALPLPPHSFTIAHRASSSPSRAIYM